MFCFIYLWGFGGGGGALGELPKPLPVFDKEHVAFWTAWVQVAAKLCLHWLRTGKPKSGGHRGAALLMVDPGPLSQGVYTMYIQADRVKPRGTSRHPLTNTGHIRVAVARTWGVTVTV